MSKLLEDLTRLLGLAITAFGKWLQFFLVVLVIGIAFVYLEASDTHIKNAFVAFENDMNAYVEGGRWPKEILDGSDFLIISWLAIYYAVFNKDVRERWEKINCRKNWIYLVPLVFCISRVIFAIHEGVKLTSLGEWFGYVVFIPAAPGILIGATLDIFWKFLKKDGENGEGKLENSKIESPNNYKVIEEKTSLTEEASSTFPVNIGSALVIKNLQSFYLIALICAVILLLVIFLKKSNSSVYEIDLAGYGFPEAGKLYVKQVTSVSEIYERVEYPNRSWEKIGAYPSTELCIRILFDGQNQTFCQYKFKQSEVMLGLFEGFGYADDKENLLIENIENIKNLKKKFNDIARKSARNF